MRGSQRGRPEIDESLLLRVAALPAGGQRWLKTALQAIAILEPEAAGQERGGAAAGPREEAPRRGVSLDEVLSGEAGRREQAEAYPELAEELEGIADIANLLREAGRERRRLGEEILREELLNGPESAEEDEEEG